MKETMKRLFLMGLLLCTMGIAAMAQEFTAEQLKLRNDIQLFLKEEGYMPEVDKDGDITFKKEGALYYVMIDKRDTSPMFLALSSDFYTYEAPYTREFLASLLPELNLNKGVKLVFRNTTFSIQGEMFLVRAETFKYAFYKLIEQIDSVEDEIKGSKPGSGASASALDTSSPIVEQTATLPGGSSIAQFFPVFGIALGQTTYKDMERKDYKVEVDKDGDAHCNVRGISFWDFNHDKRFERLYMTTSDPMPEAWVEKYGIDWKLSYNGWLAFFKKNNYSVTITEEPTTKNYQERKTFSAKLKALAPDGKLEFHMDFDYGNDLDEGYSASSRNTLYSITMEAYL